MKCKKHISDLSSSLGVCASCLRERLFSLIAAQAQAQALAQADEDRRKSDLHPPPLIFPRSVSPYICRRKSDNSSWSHHHHHHHHHHPTIPDQRFYSTPQVGPTKTNTTATATTFIESSCNKKKHSRFSLLSNLFRSKSEKPDPDPDPRFSRNSCATSSSSSPSWFPSLLSGRRKKQSRLFSLEDTTTGVHRPRRTRDRGMSPARAWDDDEDYEDYEGSPSASGYSSESSQGWRRTPKSSAAAVAQSAVRRGRPGHGRNVSGLAFCLSPLVRASPNRHWNQKGMPPEIGLSGEIRVPNKPHLSTASSFCANRSRKLADFGRFNYNH